MGGARDQIVGIPRRQVRSEQVHRRQMQSTIGHSVEERRMLPRRPRGVAWRGVAWRGVDALVGSIVREPELVNAVRMHGRIAGLEMDVPRLDFGKVGQDQGGDAAILGDWIHELGLRETFEILRGDSRE